MSPPASLPKNYSGLELDFHTLANHVPQLAWMAQADGYLFWYNQRWYEYTGTTLDQVRGWGWSIVHDPVHVDRVKAGFERCLASGEPWEDTFPLRRHDGEWRWFLSRAHPIRDNDGKVIRWFGTNTDITERKENEENNLRLMREIDHRAKNALAVAQAIVKLSSGDTIEEYRSAVEGRIAALSRAHMLLADSLWHDIDLHNIVDAEIAAHAMSQERTVIAGDTIGIDPALVQPLELLLSELMSNAQKYGALSQGSSGTLTIKWRRCENDMIEIEWREDGVEGVCQPATLGFGLRVMERIIHQQLGGRIESSWRSDGVSYVIAIPHAQSGK